MIESAVSPPIQIRQGAVVEVLNAIYEERQEGVSRNESKPPAKSSDSRKAK
jgi:hypothetical protein